MAVGFDKPNACAAKFIPDVLAAFERCTVVAGILEVVKHWSEVLASIKNTILLTHRDSRVVQFGNLNAQGVDWSLWGGRKKVLVRYNSSGYAHKYVSWSSLSSFNLRLIPRRRIY
jgi:hypothetical protein